MNSFVGRDQELKILNDIYETRDSFILLTGMRHSGKTGLIKAFSEDKPVFYFSSGPISDELNRENFINVLSEYFSVKNIKKTPLPTWEQIFKAYADKAEETRKVLIIDNLDYLLQSNTDLIRILPDIWNKILKPKNVMLIVVLSNSFILSTLENERNPLISSVSLQIKLQPIPFIEMLRHFKDKSFSEVVSLYAITGGIPKYWEFFTDSGSISEQLEKVRENMLNPSGWFYELPLYMIEKDVWDPIYYSTVMAALANGSNTIREISNQTGYREKNVKTYLKNLESLGYIKSEVSVNRKKYSSKNARFFFKNPMMRFWYRYVFPNQSFLEIGNEEYVLKKIRHDYSFFLQEGFKNIAKEIFTTAAKQGSLDFQIDQLGSYWNKDAEVPIVAIDHARKQIFFADTSFSPVSYSLNQFDDFMGRTKKITDFRKYKDYRILYGLFVARQPDTALINYAGQVDNIILFNGTALYKKR